MRKNKVKSLRDTLKCNQPVKQESGGKKFVVKACTDGKEAIVRFGDASMGHYREGGSSGRGHGDAQRRENFKSRHNCSEKKDKTKPGYWSCNWSW